MTAERQNRTVALRNINVLAAAQTDRHVSDASRTVGVIEQRAFAQRVLQLFHFTASLYPKARISLALACPSINRRGRPGVWGRAI
jgi:hypothetical protein